MLYFDRSSVAPPHYLASPMMRRRRGKYLEFLRLEQEAQYQTKPPDRHISPDETLYMATNILFLGKCAFCERRGNSHTMYRFRPTSEAEPHEKSPLAYHYYGWLADAWQNIYPICDDCRPRRMAWFPVEGKRAPMPTPEEYEAYLKANDGLWPSHPPAEEPLLLDPCEIRDFSEHLEMLPDGMFVPKTRAAEMTIVHFRLNRSALVQARSKALGSYLRRFPDPDPLPPPPERRVVADMEHGGAILLYLSRGTGYSTREHTIAPAEESSAGSLASAPQIARIEVENFKGLETLSFNIIEPDPELEQARATLILGENACGKSSILEAIALAMMPVSARRKIAPKPKTLLLDSRFMGAAKPYQRKKSLVRLIFDDDSRLEMKITPQGITTTQTCEAARQPVFAYGAYRHYLDTLRQWKAERPVLSLFKSDDLLSNPERWLLSLDQDEFRMVVRALRDVFGSAESFDVIERDMRRKTCFVVTSIDGQNQARTPLDSVSSGFRTILALICDVMRWLMDRRRNPEFQSLVSARGIVLIDEVEAHLHPRWKIQIMQGLRKALPSMTIIATTHDPLCLRGMHDGEVKVLERMPGEVLGSNLPIMVQVLTDFEDLSQLTVEQLLTSDLFSLFSTDHPSIEQDIATLTDELSLPGDMDNAELARLRQKIAESLPIGHSEALRLVQKAVAQYLRKRGRTAQDKLAKLQSDTVARIVRILEQH